MRYLRSFPLVLGILAIVAGTAVVTFVSKRDALGGVLIGGGLAVAVDGYRRERDADDQRERRRLESLDERRRLLYMALAMSQTPPEGSSRAELAGTIANALAHHAEPDKRISELVAENWAIALTINRGEPTIHEAIRAEIAKITSELGDGRPPSDPQAGP